MEEGSELEIPQLMRLILTMNSRSISVLYVRACSWMYVRGSGALSGDLLVELVNLYEWEVNCDVSTEENIMLRI